jgi:hypothetical protein
MKSINTNKCFISLDEEGDEAEVVFNHEVMTATLSAYGFCLAHNTNTNKNFLLTREYTDEDVSLSLVTIH